MQVAQQPTEGMNQGPTNSPCGSRSPTRADSQRFGGVLFVAGSHISPTAVLQQFESGMPADFRCVSLSNPSARELTLLGFSISCSSSLAAMSIHFPRRLPGPLLRPAFAISIVFLVLNVQLLSAESWDVLLSAVGRKLNARDFVIPEKKKKRHVCVFPGVQYSSFPPVRQL